MRAQKCSINQLIIIFCILQPFIIQDMEHTHPWTALQKHYDTQVKPKHLRQLLQDEERNAKFIAQYEDLIFDYSHEKMTSQTIHQFQNLVKSTNLRNKVKDLFNGQHINFTQDRAVLHTVLRAPKNSTVHPQMSKTLEDVHSILNRIQSFSNSIRNGQHLGATGKLLKNLIIIGIGGSYLSIQFVYQALRSHPKYKASSHGRTLRFLANVDPIDFNRAVQGLNVQQTLILVNSKTFTTAQTILNAKSVKQWLLKGYETLNLPANEIISKHVCACSTNLELTGKFGIDDKNVFAFWDFVGGRFSVWSSIGILPLSIHFGYDVMQQFLGGGHQIDKLLVTENDLQKNIPMLLGLIGFYRTTVQHHSARAIIPYCQALCKFAPHIQQLDMESNGKRINKEGEVVTYETAVVNFGQPGTNGQHSFFQLLHQGRVVPVQFIGFTKSQQPYHVKDQTVNNHDELMSNFFSQPDALACGKTKQQLVSEKQKQHLIPHKQFPGDRPSSSILFTNELDARKCGQLLALYEHRTSIQGFLFNVNSYDQYGVQLGKVLAKRVRNILHQGKLDAKQPKLNSATKNLLELYLKHNK